MHSGLELVANHRTGIHLQAEGLILLSTAAVVLGFSQGCFQIFGDPYVTDICLVC